MPFAGTALRQTRSTKALLLGCALAESSYCWLCYRSADHFILEIISQKKNKGTAERKAVIYVKYQFLEYCLYDHQHSGLISVFEAFPYEAGHGDPGEKADGRKKLDEAAVSSRDADLLKKNMAFP